MMASQMTAQSVDYALTGDVLSHLNTQLASARRMLAIVLEQATAIRERQVPTIVRLAGALQAEMHRREVIEIERESLMTRAAAKLRVAPEEVTIAMVASVMDEESARVAINRTTELRELLEEIQSEHQTNRALMQQELAFLDHLLRLAGSAGGYESTGDRVSTRRRAPMMRQSVFELEV